MKANKANLNVNVYYKGENFDGKNYDIGNGSIDISIYMVDPTGDRRSDRMSINRGDSLEDVLDRANATLQKVTGLPEIDGEINQAYCGVDRLNVGIHQITHPSQQLYSATEVEGGETTFLGMVKCATTHLNSQHGAEWSFLDDGPSNLYEYFTRVAYGVGNSVHVQDKPNGTDSVEQKIQIMPPSSTNPDRLTIPIDSPLFLSKSPRLRLYRTEASPGILEMILSSDNCNVAESVANNIAKWYKQTYGQALQVEQVSGHRYSYCRSYQLVGHTNRNGRSEGGFQDSVPYFRVSSHYSYTEDGTVIRIISADKARPNALANYAKIRTSENR